MHFAWLSNKDIAIHYSCSPYNAKQKCKRHNEIFDESRKKKWNPPKIKETSKLPVQCIDNIVMFYVR